MTISTRVRNRISVVFAIALMTSVFALPAAAESNDEDGQPFVRITFMCVVPEDPDGSHISFFTGTDTELHSAEAGQYIWRIGDARDADLWDEGVDSAEYSTNFLDMTGTAYPGVANLHATEDPAAGVSVSTDPGPNKSGGTASATEDQICTMTFPEPEDRADCKQGGWADFGFRNQGQCIASAQSNENSRHNR